MGQENTDAVTNYATAHHLHYGYHGIHFYYFLIADTVSGCDLNRSFLLFENGNSNKHSLQTLVNRKAFQDARHLNLQQQNTTVDCAPVSRGVDS